jgi:protein-disulfide isomerase
MKEQKNNLGVPVAIVLAGVLVAGAVMMSNSSGNQDALVQEQPTPQVPQQPVPTGNLDAIAPITSADHIKGNPDAKVVIVEYSDFECPFCKRFNGTMNQIMAKYEASGDVALVFRQFPLDSLHPVKARQEALASECAADQGGDDMFWKFADRMFELTLTNNRTDIATVIPQIGAEIGLDEAEFKECIESERLMANVEADIADAVATGGRGTPWSVLIAPDGTKYPINGAQSFETVSQLIEVALQK